MLLCQLANCVILPASLVSTISVAEFNGSNKKTIITVEKGIHSIAVDPIGG